MSMGMDAVFTLRVAKRLSRRFEGSRDTCGRVGNMLAQALLHERRSARKTIALECVRSSGDLKFWRGTPVVWRTSSATTA
jgi:hypothetical protein